MVASITTPRLALVPLTPQALRALLGGDRARAEEIIGLDLPAEFPNATNTSSGTAASTGHPA
jgi:hypothetical protein